MRFLAAFKKPLQVSLAAVLLLSGTVATAQTVEEDPSAGAMVIDAVLARPLYFALSQVGSLVYGATLPFTLLGGNAEQAAETLVVTPLQAAFVRCLGCGKMPNQVGELKEGEGKFIRHFVMLSAGQANYNESLVDVSGSAIGGGLFLGTHFSLNDDSRYDVLLGYRTFGTAELDKNGTEFEDTASSIQIASRFGKRIFWDLELMGKLGLHRWSAERKVNNSTSSSSGFGFLYGIGVERFVSDNLRLGLDYTVYSLNKKDEYEADVSTADLNISYMF